MTTNTDKQQITLNMFHTEIIEGELYLYFQGKLIYKRWFNESGDIKTKDRSVVLDLYGPPIELPKTSES